jgi:phage head maturation protease
MDDTLIAYAGAMKALGNGKVGGLLVRYSDPTAPDLEGEFFTKATDFSLEFPAKVGVYYNHGLDPTLGKRRIGRAEVKAHDEGLWFETQLDLSDQYQAQVYKLAQSGRLGASSGAAAHLVEKKAAGKSVEILSWPVAEASLTVTPAEPRNAVVALKSWEPVSLEEAAGAILPNNFPLGDLVSGSTLAQHSEAVVSANSEYAQRLASRLEARVKAGRKLSAETVAELEGVLCSLDGLVSVRDQLTAILSKAAPKQEPNSDDAPPESSGDQAALNATALYADVQRTLAQVLSPVAG